MNDTDFQFYLNKIDLSKLTRDYIKFPLQRTGKFIEKPNLDDLRYLYLDLNLSWNFLNKYFGYKFQEFACANGLKKSPLLVKEARELTLLRNVGSKNISSLEEIKKKKANTCLRHYGVDNPSKVKEIINKIKETTNKHYGYETYFSSQDFKEKYKNKMLNKYGVDNPSKVKEILDKIRNTKQERYGNSKYHNIEKMWSTNKERYGSKYYFSSEKFKKIQQLNLENHLKKSYQTKKANHTFNTSKEEVSIFNLLKEKYPDTISQYREERYPFNCDFYIPSLDVFIEYQGTWLHNNHPYNPNNPEDLKKVKEWKENSNKYNGKKNLYSMAIYTWTDLDVRKREIAKVNGLNYLEFFNIEEFMDWYNKQ